MSSFPADVLADLAELIRNPRRWWHNATHARCPVCGQSVHVGADCRCWRAACHSSGGWVAWWTCQSGGQP